MVLTPAAVSKADIAMNPCRSNGASTVLWVPLGASCPDAGGVPGDHPMSWTYAKLGGTVFYTTLGRQTGLYSTDWYRRHPLDPGAMIASGQGV